MKDLSGPQYSYKDLDAPERLLAANFIQAVATDPEIMQSVRERDEEGARCGVVVITEAGEFVDGFTGDQDVLMEMFPFDPVRDALSTYSLPDSFCLLLVRDGNVVALVGSTGSTS